MKKAATTIGADPNPAAHSPEVHPAQAAPSAAPKAPARNAVPEARVPSVTHSAVDLGPRKEKDIAIRVVDRLKPPIT